jgi:hypothetical protein
VSAVKARIKTSDLRQVRHALKERFDRSEVVWLMKRRERREFREFGQDFPCDPGRTIEPRTTVNDAVAHADKPPILVLRPQPTGEHLNGCSPIVDGFVELFVDDLFAIAVLNGEPRRGSDSFDLSACVDAPLEAVILLVNAELQTGGAGVQDQR